MFLIITLFVIGNVLAWFQSNSQFMWTWWYDHPITTVLIYSIPTGLAFFYGWRYAVEHFDGSLWAARMFAFGVAGAYLGFNLLAHLKKHFDNVQQTNGIVGIVLLSHAVFAVLLKLYFFKHILIKEEETF